MKPLQRDFTTPEQAQRLLALGVPAWTADIMFDVNRRRYELIETGDESWAETQRTLLYNSGAIPHWSVGRLMEIYEIVGENAGQCISCSRSLSRIEGLVQLFEENASLLDFSKLED